MSLALISALLGGIVFVVTALKQWLSKIVQAVKDSLQKRGLYVTSRGVTVRTNKTYDHEQYIDDTRRILVGIIKASSFGTNENKQSLADFVTFVEVPRVRKVMPLPA